MSKYHTAGSIEFEAKFLDVDKEEIQKKLSGLGATCVHPRRLMRRTNMDFADGRLDKQGAWLRLRDEGNDLVNLTLKTNRSDTRVDGIHELETRVTNYDETLALLRAIGLADKSYQETYRESWQLGNVQIEFDEWPWLPLFVEIEGRSEAEVRRIAEKLGLSWSQALFGPVHTAYKAKFDVTADEVNHLPKYSFDEQPPWSRKV